MSGKHLLFLCRAHSATGPRICIRLETVNWEHKSGNYEILLKFQEWNRYSSGRFEAKRLSLLCFLTTYILSSVTCFYTQLVHFMFHFQIFANRCTDERKFISLQTPLYVYSWYSQARWNRSKHNQGLKTLNVLLMLTCSSYNAMLQSYIPFVFTFDRRPLRSWSSIITGFRRFYPSILLSGFQSAVNLSTFIMWW